MAILELLESPPGDGPRYLVVCPGCNMEHLIPTGAGKGPRWTFNGNMDSPTFSPSVLVTYTWGVEERSVVCHSFIVDGKWQYLSDCTHQYAGQTIDIPKVGSID